MHFLRDGERTEVRPGLDYTTIDSRYNCILAHNQSETDGYLGFKARAGDAHLMHLYFETTLGVDAH